MLFVHSSTFFAKVWLTSKGNAIVASHVTFTGLAVILIFPQEIASSGEAPLSLPSNSWPVQIGGRSKQYEDQRENRALFARDKTYQC